jgi:pyruvate formate lyase activating enzyme
VVITGGEPTLQKDLPQLIRKIKDLGYLVCLETNGTNPGMLEELLKGNLLDCLAMDIKAAPERYRDVVKAEVDMDKVRRSAGIVRNSGIEYQFRTTYVPGLVGKEDARGIGRWLKGSESYAVQNFRPKKCLDKAFESRVPYSKEEIEEIAGVAREFFKKVVVR